MRPLGKAGPGIKAQTAPAPGKAMGISTAGDLGYRVLAAVMCSRVARSQRSSEADGSPLVALIPLAFLYVLFLLLAGPTANGRATEFWLALNYGVFVVSGVATVVLHEAGHALAAVLLRFHVFAVVIGYGRSIREWDLRGRMLQLNAVPFSGFVIAATRQGRLLRPRLWALFAAGPAVNAALILLLWHALPDRGAPDLLTAPAPVPALLFWNGLALLLSLFPATRQTHVGVGASDGLMLVRISLMSREKLSVFLNAYEPCLAWVAMWRQDFATARRLCEEGLLRNPMDVTFRACLGTLNLLAGRFSEAREQLRALLDDPAAQTVKASICNNLAWADVCLGTPELLHEADRCSAEAMRAAPHEPAFKGTRGAVFIRLGHLDSGVSYCREAFRANRRPSARAINACWIAIGEALKKNHPEALRWLESAEALDSACVLLPMAKSNVEARRT